MHILILGNDPKTLVNFRGPLIEAMLNAGHRVTAAAGRDAKLMPWFAARGVAYHDVPIERAGLNPLSDVRTLTAFVRLMRDVRPALLFAYMIKPMVYGLIAAKIAGEKRRTAMITGLGYAFTESPHDGWRARAKRGAVHDGRKPSRRRRRSWQSRRQTQAVCEEVFGDDAADGARDGEDGLHARVFAGVARRCAVPKADGSASASMGSGSRLEQT